MSASISHPVPHALKTSSIHVRPTLCVSPLLFYMLNMARRGFWVPDTSFPAHPHAHAPRFKVLMTKTRAETGDDPSSPPAQLTVPADVDFHFKTGSSNSTALRPSSKVRLLRQPNPPTRLSSDAAQSAWTKSGLDQNLKIDLILPRRRPKASPHYRISIAMIPASFTHDIEQSRENGAYIVSLAT
ncbi:hypothetical protein RRG08_007938 [Elysia crispata]|uniref:Uncharacterized protein n=1 Tax=Elysia crispata TaxID=231223 RepID=A0AAE0ZQ34_9GAST|nr:hypothetical protein RRG08_007938 [Elysia crispata]